MDLLMKNLSKDDKDDTYSMEAESKTLLNEYYVDMELFSK
jgi:hypothetical protein